MAIQQISLTPVRDAARRKAIIDAVARYDLRASDAWANLEILSAETVPDSIEANPDGIFDAAPGSFEATATVYVVLNYGEKGGRFSVSDSYPALVKGTISGDGSASIDSFIVDTSSFYDGIEDEDLSPDSDNANMQ